MCFEYLIKKLYCCGKNKEVSNEASFYEYSEAVPKYYNDQIGQLTEGVSFTFTGKTLIHCERFSINLILNNDKGDVALHINPRLPQNYIVRNSKVRDIWGREEVSSALPFQIRRGDKFSIQVLITDACFMISVNGQHFTEYTHRLPYTAIGILEVKGEVEQVEMERRIAREYPDRLTNSLPKEIPLNIAETEIEVASPNEDEVDGTNIPKEWRIIATPQKLRNMETSTDASLTLPYYGTFPLNTLSEGRCVKIEGRVRLLPHSFYINLQHGQNIWPHPIIAFHFNPRFLKQASAMGKAVVCRNSWHNGSWMEEERSELDTNLRPGKTFSLAIVCAAESFEVYVNRKYITEYKYRVMPSIVDTVYIQGDIKLWSVVLENNAVIAGKKMRIYQNPIYADEYNV